MRRVVFGAAVNWVAFAAMLAVSFFLTPHFIGSLGAARYDVWCVVESVLAYFTVLDLGIAAGLVRAVARGQAKGDLAAVNAYASAAVAIFCAAGLAVLAVGGPLLWGMSARLAANGEGVRPFMLLMLLNLALTLPLSVFPAILDGLERFAAKGLVRLVMLTLRTAALVAVLASGGGLWPLAVVFTVCNLAEHGLLALGCFRAWPGLRVTPWRTDWATVRAVRSESFDAFLAMLAGRVTLQTGAVVIGLLLAPGAATFFRVATQLTEYAKLFLRQVTTTLTPGVSAMHARGDDEGVRRLLLVGTRWVLYLVLPVNLGLWLFGKPFLARWVGPEFATGSGPAVMILSATVSLGLAQSVAARVLYGLGHLRTFARAGLVEGAVNVALTAALIGPFGVEGVAAAVALPNVLFCLFVVAHTLRLLGVRWRDYLRAWLAPLAASAVPLAVWLALGTPEAEWPAIGGRIALGLAAYTIPVALAEFGGRTRAALARRLARPRLTPETTRP